MALIINNTMKNYTKTKQTEPGLVVFYDIWPVNGAGLFLQCQSPHGASDLQLLHNLQIHTVFQKTFI